MHPPKGYNNQRGSSSLLIVIAAIGILSFLLITNFFSFKDKIFNILYPKPPSSASTIIIKPIKLSVIYQPPVYPNNTALTGSEIAQKFSNIFASPDADAWKAAKDAGFTGPFLFYEVFDQTEGPPNLDTLTAQAQTCQAAGQGDYLPVGENSVTTFKGEFCQIHDSIVQKTPFDHDLDPATSSVVATEDWFLHDSNGLRITFFQGSGEYFRTYYAVNPTNQGWRDYFIARLFRALNFNPGDPINSRGWLSRIKADGIYLDNVGLGWYQFRNNSNNHSDPKEFSSSQAFADAVFSFTQQIYSKMHDSSKGYNYPVWANMIAGGYNDTDWDRYVPYLDGGLLENFVLNWGNGPYDAPRVQNQLSQAEKWINAGKEYIAIARSNPNNTEADMRYSLAAFLMVTNGVNASYRLADNSSYKFFPEYPEFYYELGAPIGAHTTKSTLPLVLRREFQCGFAELDLTNKTGAISKTPNCSLSSSPIPSPTSQVTPTPIPSPTPISKDTTKPSVSITFPLNNSTISRKATVGIQATATDNVKVAKVEFYVNNILTCTDTTSSYSCSWSVPGKPNAIYTLYAKAYDTSNNLTTSSLVKVTAH